MTGRHGFTLLELIVSIAVAGIIALLVYGSAQAAFDTRERLRHYRATSEAELRARTLLADALRHASDEANVGADAFAIENAIDASGRPIDRLTFLSRGVTPPLGASALWRVDVGISTEGLRIDATPLVDGGDVTSQSAPVTALIPSIRALDVQAMPVGDPSWVAAWPSIRQLPAAVRIALRGPDAEVGTPLIVGVGLERAR
jgi:prepilin-type N-terminal cleavage/methylation domain-containing protein